MSQHIHGHESLNLQNFKSYNNHNFSIGYMSSFIEKPSFQKLDAVTRLSILKVYKNLLFSKSYLDYFLFERKSQQLSNFRLLKKLRQHFLELNQADLVSDIEPLMNAIGPNYLTPTPSSYEFTIQLKKQINTVNTHRLDGVWSRGLIDSYIKLKNSKTTAFEAIDKNVEAVNDIASYGFYFVRGGLDLMKLAKHTFAKNKYYQPHNISALDKFWVQLKLRYAQIVNDCILWGPINCLTAHPWKDTYRGNVWTTRLLIADLLLAIGSLLYSLKFFKDTLNLFNHAVVQTELSKEFKTYCHKQWSFMAYQILLAIGFSICCGLFQYEILKEIPAIYDITGSLICFSIQVLVNLIDFFFELHAAQTSAEKQMACFNIFIRILVQLSIPALFIASTYCLPLFSIQLPPLLVIGLLVGLSSLLVKLSNDIIGLLENWMYPELLDTTKLDVSLNKIKNHHHAEPATSLNFLIDDWVEQYQIYQKKHHVGDQLIGHLWLTLGYVNLSVALCMTICSGLIATLSIPLLFASLSLVMAFSQPKANDDCVQILHNQIALGA